MLTRGADDKLDREELRKTENEAIVTALDDEYACALKGHRRGSSASKEDLDKGVADSKAKGGKAIAVKGATSPKRTRHGAAVRGNQKTLEPYAAYVSCPT